jgi:hypothetical protein
MILVIKRKVTNIRQEILSKKNDFIFYIEKLSELNYQNASLYLAIRKSI